MEEFARAVPPRHREGAQSADVRAALGRAIASARAKWPDFVDDAALASRLGRCVSDEDVLPGALEQLHVDDLALALACASGNGAAIVAFERLYFGDLERAWRGRSFDARDLDDAKQILRARLFVEGDAPPKVLGYAGRGSLRGWMRAVIAHEAMNATRRAREVPSEEALFAALPGGDEDAETAHVKRLCKGAFRESFLAAIDKLAAPERNLLRYRFAEGLSVQQIAVIYGIHRETAGLRVERARAALEAAVRNELARRLKVTDGELSSVVRMALSRFDDTLARLM